MKREELPNGAIKLTSANGIKDTRNGRVYSVVICQPQYERYFVEA